MEEKIKITYSTKKGESSLEILHSRIVGASLFQLFLRHDRNEEHH